MSKCKSRNPGNIKVEIQAGARCQLIRLWRENFSAIDVRCLSCGLPSPPPASSIHPHPLHQQHRPAGKGVSRYGGFLEYVRLAFGGTRSRSGPGNPTVQAWSRVASASQARLIPRLLPSSNIYFSCPYNPLPTYNFPN